jgi:hypothetical protein
MNFSKDETADVLTKDKARRARKMVPEFYD